MSEVLSTVSLNQIASTWSTPSFVYDLDKVRYQARALGTHIKHPRRQLLYAIKANPCPSVVRALLAEGYGIDAVSPGEVELALALGCSAEKICYTENNMTDGEMAEAIAHDVMINCGSLDRLRRLAQAGVKRAAVRFNPDIGDSEHAHTLTAGPLTKFGIHHSQIAEVCAIEREFGMEVVGCHMHIGSNVLNAESYAGAMAVIVNAAKGLPHLQWVDVGGGLGVPYQPDQAPIDVEAVGRSADALIADLEAFHGRPLELRLEPGRFLVAEAGYLLTTVTSVKTNPDGRTYVGCDSGFNHLIRPMVYGSYHPITNVTNPTGTEQVVDVVGNICESGDVFARERLLPEPRLGDVLAIGCAGAYGMSMGSTYNIRPLPAEIITEEGTPRLVRRRRTLEELLEELED